MLQVALLSPYMQREVLQQGNGVSNDKPIILPNKASLTQLLPESLARFSVFGVCSHSNPDCPHCILAMVASR